MNVNKINSWPHFDKVQIDAVKEILSSGKVNYWTGDQGKLFEKEFAEWNGSKYSVAVSNGSLALIVAYLSLGIKEGDEIITTPRTFIATSSSAVLVKAKPIFADVDENSGAITVETIEPLITKKTKAIVVVHIGGWPADMAKICDLANSYNIPVLEDCSQAHGAEIKINGKFKSVGTFGELSTWSFCQDKIISTGGEGGMVTTSEKQHWEFIRSFKDHGKDLDLMLRNDKPIGYNLIHTNFGSNLRLTEIQSAIGRQQIKYLPSWRLKREKNAKFFAAKLNDLDILRIPFPNENIKHAWYKFYIYLKEELLAEGWSRQRILSEMAFAGYPALTGTCSEIYLEKCFKELDLNPKERLPVAKELGETSLMLLVHPTIDEKQIQEYASTLKKILIRATR